MIASHFPEKVNFGKRWIIIIAFLLTAIATFGQSVGDYQTNGNVTFAAAANWQTWNGSDLFTTKPNRATMSVVPNAIFLQKGRDTSGPRAQPD